MGLEGRGLGPSPVSRPISFVSRDFGGVPYKGPQGFFRGYLGATQVYRDCIRFVEVLPKGFTFIHPPGRRRA